MTRISSALGVLVIAGLTSCESVVISSKGGAPAAEVAGVSVEQIGDAGMEVMSENGYQFVAREGNVFLFERKGSVMADLAWGNWTQEGVWERVQLRVREQGPDAHLIECIPAMVTNRDSGFEDRHAMPRTRQGKYRKLVEQIRARLGQD